LWTQAVYSNALRTKGETDVSQTKTQKGGEKKRNTDVVEESKPFNHMDLAQGAVSGAKGLSLRVRPATSVWGGGVEGK